ncbi:unnamed protein product [Didymodactylos carnosus]|uniref:Uncharacterized protein n=1 Tax=Didymodactylos carnosus TaxID=1234261 RepID=A0A8S2FYN3_9BILA|nr:unnamed protein product [Didymodactylos carnosus]CAF4364874.1 unnamed protein product [Didymodactylos carnosus]
MSMKFTEVMLGNFKLKPSFEFLSMDRSSVHSLDCYHPSDLVQNLRERMTVQMTTKINVNQRRKEKNRCVFIVENKSKAETTIVQLKLNEKRVPYFWCLCAVSNLHKRKYDCLHVMAVKRQQNIHVIEPKANLSILRKASKIEARIKKTGEKTPTAWDKSHVRYCDLHLQLLN